jgi:hypothetical protein
LTVSCDTKVITRRPIGRQCNPSSVCASVVKTIESADERLKYTHTHTKLTNCTHAPLLASVRERKSVKRRASRSSRVEPAIPVSYTHSTTTLHTFEPAVRPCNSHFKVTTCSTCSSCGLPASPATDHLRHDPVRNR